MSIRPEWDEWALGIARAVSLRGDCTRRQVGAVILGPDHEPISFGYNGAPSGAPGCLTDGACPRGRHYLSKGGVAGDFDDWPAAKLGQARCSCGGLWPCPEGVPAGSSYDTGPGACISIHAEANALLWAGQSRLKGATVYVTEEPCGGCWKLLKSAQLQRAVWPGERGGLPGLLDKRAPLLSDDRPYHYFRKVGYHAEED